MSEVSGTAPYTLDDGRNIRVSLRYHKESQRRLEIGGYETSDITNLTTHVLLHRNELSPRVVVVKLDDGSKLKTIIRTLDKFTQLRSNPDLGWGEIIRAYGENQFRFYLNL